MTVENFMKIVWTVFEKFEIFMKRSGEKKQKKRHDWISSRKIFPTPKNQRENPRDKLRQIITRIDHVGLHINLLMDRIKKGELKYGMCE